MQLRDSLGMRMAAAAAAIALVPLAVATTGSTADAAEYAFIDIELGDFVEAVEWTRGGDRKGWVGTDPIAVEAGENVNIGGYDDGYAFTARGKQGTLIGAVTSDGEDVGWNHSFVPEAGETYSFRFDFEAYLTPSPDSYLVGKLPFQPGAPNEEYYPELDDSSGLLRFVNGIGTLKDGDPFTAAASFEDNGIATEVELTIDELELEFDDDGNLVDYTVDGTHVTSWPPYGGSHTRDVRHVEANFHDELMEVSFFGFEGGASLGDLVLEREPRPWGPPSGPPSPESPPGGGGGLPR